MKQHKMCGHIGIGIQNVDYFRVIPDVIRLLRVYALKFDKF